ncbi:MAG: fumarate reductase flavoprotein subunit [Gammaproteobacteria bacterium]|jgi:fumarate reductase flavoprotein subunit
MNFETTKTDVLILGSGGAGLFAALHAKKSNPDLNITVAVKGLMGKCGCTRMVQGGYNVALSPGDSVERHFMDTIRGGKWLPHQDMAMRLCETAVIRVQELENELGCFFDRNNDGSLHHKAFAGQTFDRTVHKGDLTGIEIISRLMEQVRALPVDLMEEHRALDFILSPSGDALAGVLMTDMRTGEFRMVQAKTVLMATGGGPTMYRYHTPSGDKSMDGLAMAMRIGLGLRDMEMVQFHPTGLLAGRDTRMTGTVLEEGLRGAGGYLLDGDGRRFMADYDEAGERATRDIVSRAIYAEMRAGRTTPNGGVYIAMSHLGPDNVASRFPGMVKRCADCGFDLAGGQVEVVPTAHYLMGGVIVEPDTRTALPGLFVAGEDAGGAHGANRLGGNGVANSTVFGGIAGEEMAPQAETQRYWIDADKEQIDEAINQAMTPFRRPAGNINPIRDRLLDLMWDKVGVLRDAAGMLEARSELADLKTELLETGLGDDNRIFNLSWHDWINLRNLIDMSDVIAASGLSRENSRGAHFREDFVEVGSLEDSYFTIATRNADEVLVGRESVKFNIVKPGESLLDDD